MNQAYITHLQNRLDTSIRPQDDFFSYVNKKWLKDNPIPPTEIRWGAFYVLRDVSIKRLHGICEDIVSQTQAKGSIAQKVSDYYWTCMHRDELTTAHLKEIDTLLQTIHDIKDITSLYSVLGTLHRYNIDIFWRFGADYDRKNSSQFIAQLFQGGITLPDKDYYLSKDSKMAQIRKLYKKFIPEISTMISTETVPDVLSIFNLEKAIASTMMSPAESRDLQKTYNPTTFDSLKSTYKNIAWSNYFETLGWHPKGTIIVQHPPFLDHINALSKPSELVHLKEYMSWRVSCTLAALISEQLATVSYEFFGKQLAGQNRQQPLWKRSVQLIDRTFGYALGSLYTERYFPPEAQHTALEIVEDVRKAFAERISQLSWMSAKTKHYALRKLANITVLMGYGEDTRNYTAYTFTRNSLVQNYLHATANETAHDIARIGAKPNKKEMFMTPQTVNAYHDPSQLVIAFPAGILQEPFFDTTAPAIANYAGIGAVTGHEFTHGFDDQGCQFDANGNVNNWRTKQDKTNFDKQASLLSKNADDFEVLPGLHMQGALVIGEAIADLGGLEIALSAYKNHIYQTENRSLTIQELQLFYIAFATTECHATTDAALQQYTLIDPHPNEKFRVNGTVQHCSDFYTAFNVSLGDALFVPEDERVVIW